MIKPAERLDLIEEYYFSKRAKEIAKVRESGKKILNFSIGNPDLPPASSVIDALYKSARNPNNHGYQPYAGTPELKEAFAEWYGETFGVELNPATEILPLIGSKEGLYHISMAYLNPGDTALVPNPGYAVYAVATKLAGGTPIYYDLDESDNWLPALEKIDEEAARNAKIMWINYPNMPTGAVATKSDLQKIVDFARKYDLLLCNDNPYSLVLPQQEPLSVLSLDGAKEIAVEFNSLSKSHNMAGWRIGMVAGRNELIAPILKFMSNINTGIFKPIQDGAIYALRNVDEKWHEERNSIYAKRKEMIFEIIEMLGLTANKKTNGMFVWAKVPEKIKDVDEFVDKLLYEFGIVLTPGRIFGSNGNRFVRFSLGVKEEEIAEAVEIIRRNRDKFA